jgi:hypothetical protein
MLHMAEVEPWARAGLEAFLHAFGHGRGTEESDRRHAVLGYDVAVEGTITGFLREGPGLLDTSPAADRARSPGAKFWPKVVWLVEHTRRAALPFSYSDEDVNRLRSVRNEVQHGGAWWVPDPETVEMGRAIAVAVVRCLVGVDLSRSHQRGVPSTTVATTSRSIGIRPVSAGRPLVEAAWALARQIDPDAEGVHFGHLTLRLEESGFEIDASRRPAERVVYDALNHAHDRFRRVEGARGVWRWTEPSERNPRLGLSGVRLADECYTGAQAIDPERHGVNYSREIVPALLARGIAIRGVDVGASVNRAMRADPRFQKVAGRPGVYRWS